MTIGMKLFSFLWLIMSTRMVGALIASRHCLRIRKATKNRTIYEWFTAFGVGMGMYALSDFLLIWNSISNINPQVAELFHTSYLVQAIIYQMVQTLGVWIVVLVLMNGTTPGWIRKGLFWGLERVGVSHAPKPTPDLGHELLTRVKEIGESTARAEETAAIVADDLGARTERADIAAAARPDAPPGTAADAALQSPPGEANNVKLKEK